MKRTKIKNWIIITLCIIGMGTGMTACGGDDGDEEEAYVPVESPFASMVKSKGVKDASCEVNKYGWESYTMSSDPMVGNTKTDYYIVSFTIKDTPVKHRESGRYKLADVSANIDGFNQWKEYVKNTLRAGYDEDETGTIAKGAWVELQYLGETDGYSHPKYTVKFHADELTEENGDYARNVNTSYTGYIYNGMLKY